MGKRGPAPKPSALRVIEGNRGRRPLNKREPKPTPITPSCPSHLARAARTEWERIVPELERMGLMTIVDRAGLAAYCQAWARWREAELALKAEGYVIQSRGMRVKNPWLAVADKAILQIRAFSSEFGFTPAARTRIQVPKQANDDDMGEFFD
jgi:P27 family predicted phage terminase small subunit